MSNRSRGSSDYSVIICLIVCLSAIFIAVLAVSGYGEARQHEWSPDPTTWTNGHPALTPQEKAHLGLLHRLSASTLLELTIEEQKEPGSVDPDFAAQVEAAYEWSDRAAGVQAIFNNSPTPPSSPREEPAPEPKDKSDSNPTKAGPTALCLRCKRPIHVDPATLDDTYWQTYECPCGVVLTLLLGDNGQIDVGVFGG